MNRTFTQGGDPRESECNSYVVDTEAPVITYIPYLNQPSDFEYFVEDDLKIVREKGDEVCKEMVDEIQKSAYHDDLYVVNRKIENLNVFLEYLEETGKGNPLSSEKNDRTDAQESLNDPYDGTYETS